MSASVLGFIEHAKRSGRPMPAALATTVLAVALREAARSRRLLRPDLVLVDEIGRLTLAPPSVSDGPVHPAYQAPEVRAGMVSPEEPQALVYAAGAFGWHLLTGAPPVDEPQVQEGEPRWGLGELLRKALRQDRRERFATLDEFCRAVEGMTAKLTLEQERRILGAVAGFSFPKGSAPPPQASPPPPAEVRSAPPPPPPQEQQPPAAAAAVAEAPPARASTRKSRTRSNPRQPKTEPPPPAQASRPPQAAVGFKLEPPSAGDGPVPLPGAGPPPEPVRPLTLPMPRSDDGSPQQGSALAEAQVSALADAVLQLEAGLAATASDLTEERTQRLEALGHLARRLAALEMAPRPAGLGIDPRRLAEFERTLRALAEDQYRLGTELAERTRPASVWRTRAFSFGAGGLGGVAGAFILWFFSGISDVADPSRLQAQPPAAAAAAAPAAPKDAAPPAPVRPPTIDLLTQLLERAEKAQATGDLGAAEVALRSAVALEPNSPKAVRALATLLTKAKRDAEARTYWQRLLDLEPPPPAPEPERGRRGQVRQPPVKGR